MIISEMKKLFVLLIRETERARERVFYVQGSANLFLLKQILKLITHE
jgi:hypothetical protein